MRRSVVGFTLGRWAPLEDGHPWKSGESRRGGYQSRRRNGVGAGVRRVSETRYHHSGGVFIECRRLGITVAVVALGSVAARASIAARLFCGCCCCCGEIAARRVSIAAWRWIWVSSDAMGSLLLSTDRCCGRGLTGIAVRMEWCRTACTMPWSRRRDRNC